jgi:stage II sporulation protein D
MAVRLKIYLVFFLVIMGGAAKAQVKIRIFSSQSPESAVFSVTGGEYNIDLLNGVIIGVQKDEPVIIARFNGKLAVKKRNETGFFCDSLVFSGKTGADSFSLRINGKNPVKQYYSGDLQCFSDLGKLVFINTTDVEKYIAGVVMAEGGPGKNLEYFKTQAIIARTYLYKYFDKHLTDRYNVCDDIHCQAFNGLSADTLLTSGALETSGLVILDKDSTLIAAAFSSNCGGETSSAEDVWLFGQPCLKSVVDPYCVTSRNATWRKSFPRSEWINYLKKSGYSDQGTDSSEFIFPQLTRLSEYKSGSFQMPLTKMRMDLNLRSTFFSVSAEGDSIILHGRGYGHGVGLCQEGAMTMALRGFRYPAIIDFYYSGVKISDIKNAVVLPSNTALRQLFPSTLSTGN